MTRSEVVLAVLASANGASLSPAQLQKAVFLLARNAPDLFTEGQAFNFVPYDYGPFDKGVYDEAANLANAGAAAIAPAAYGRWNVYSATEHGLRLGREVMAQLSDAKRDYIQQVVDWVRQQSFTSLVKSIYAAYPDMRVNSIFQG